MCYVSFLLFSRFTSTYSHRTTFHPVISVEISRLSLFYVCDTLEMNKMCLSCATCEKFLFPVYIRGKMDDEQLSVIIIVMLCFRWARGKNIAEKVRVDKGVNLGQLYWCRKFVYDEIHWSELSQRLIKLNLCY